MAVRKRSGPVESENRKKCVFCSRIGSLLRIDLEKNEQPPEELTRFQIVLESGYGFTGFSVLKCPDCGTCFQKERHTDNEILYGFDVDEYREITPTRVEELIAFAARAKPGS